MPAMDMLHHLSFGVSDMEKSARFYDAVLATLGYVRVWQVIEGTACQAVGYGTAGADDKFAIKLRGSATVAPGPGFHLAFAAPDRSAVNRFHAAAVRTGGQDDGPPGLRPAYGADYYAAFVLDPDGYRLEAVVIAAT
jgi:catechol 2,3-dioxygenase-like lactoylglutathione lyase family enzyme